MTALYEPRRVGELNAPPLQPAAPRCADCERLQRARPDQPVDLNRQPSLF